MRIRCALDVRAGRRPCGVRACTLSATPQSPSAVRQAAGNWQGATRIPHGHGPTHKMVLTVYRNLTPGHGCMSMDGAPQIDRVAWAVHYDSSGQCNLLRACVCSVRSLYPGDLLYYCAESGCPGCAVSMSMSMSMGMPPVALQVRWLGVNPFWTKVLSHSAACAART